MIMRLIKLARFGIFAGGFLYFIGGPSVSKLLEEKSSYFIEENSDFIEETEAQ